MLKALVIGVAVIAAIVAIVLAYAATRPDRFEVARSTRIKAPANKIFPLINDLHAFNTWNPFEKKDPNIKGTYSGPSGGKGASFGWPQAASSASKSSTAPRAITRPSAPARSRIPRKCARGRWRRSSGPGA